MSSARNAHCNKTHSRPNKNGSRITSGSRFLLCQSYKSGYEILPKNALVRSLLGWSKTSLGVPLFHNDAAVHKDDAVGDIAGKAHLVRHDDHGHTVVRQVAHDAQNVAHELRVERRGGLVKEHHVRVHRQGAGDGHALLLAARELARHKVDALGQADLGQLLDGDLLGLFLLRLSTFCCASMTFFLTDRCGNRLNC